MNTHAVGRRPALLALFLVILTLVAACSAPEQTEPEFRGALTLWAAPGLAGYAAGVNSPDGAWFAERARAYEAAHPGVTVHVNLFATPDALETAAEALVTSGQAPDLLFGRFLPALAPKLADVRPLLDAGTQADYLPGSLAAFEKEGKLHGLPALLEVHVLALNTELFAARGVSLPQTGPWPIDDFERALQKLSVNEQYGLGFYVVPGYHEYWPFLTGVATRDGAIADEEGLDRLNRYRKQGWLHPDTAKVTAAETWDLFARKRFAMMPAGAWALPLLRGEPYNLNLAIAGFPGDVTTTGYTYGFSVFRQEDSRKLKAATELAQFLAAPDQQVRLARVTGLMPARKSAGNPFRDDPLLTGAYQLAAWQRPLPAGPAWAALEGPLSQELRLALVGGRTPKAALEQIRILFANRATTSGN